MMNNTKQSDGKYHIEGKTFDELTGSRAKVFHGTAYKTTGGLRKCDLYQNKNGRFVSLKKHRTAKKEKRLEKAGYVTKKGVFGSVKKSVVTKKSGSKKRSAKKSSSKKSRTQKRK
jgi:hypothetical protein